MNGIGGLRTSVWSLNGLVIQKWKKREGGGRKREKGGRERGEERGKGGKRERGPEKQTEKRGRERERRE